MLAAPAAMHLGAAQVMPAASQTTHPGSRALEWLRQVGWSPTSIEPLEGDVSARRYHRVRRPDGHTAILATYPADLMATCDRFLTSHQLLSGCGIRVPEILAADCERGRMLLEDLGSETLYDRRDRGWEYLAPRLEIAAAIIPRLEAIPADEVADLNPPLDLSLMSAELLNTWTVALGVAGLAKSGLPSTLEVGLESMLEELDSAAPTPCHRDFMARNLIPLERGPTNGPAGQAPELSLIDFQDLRLGPGTYDLASLLNDSLYAPEELEESILSSSLSSPAQRLDYHRCAAQRTLKIIGTFVGFSQRGSGRHLRLVAPTLERTRRHLRALPELEPCRAAVDALCNDLLSASSGR